MNHLVHWFKPTLQAHETLLHMGWRRALVGCSQCSTRSANHRQLWFDGLLVYLPGSGSRWFNAGSLHTRAQLLNAAKLMRTECGVNALGRLHTRTLTDELGLFLVYWFRGSGFSGSKKNKFSGTTLLVTVSFVEDMKSVQGVAVKWGTLSKLMKKKSTAGTSTKLKYFLEYKIVFNYLLIYRFFIAAQKMRIPRTTRCRMQIRYWTLYHCNCWTFWIFMSMFKFLQKFTVNDYHKWT